MTTKMDEKAKQEDLIRRVVNVPIRSLTRATKTIVFELADGVRFCLVGGRDQRGTRKDEACFSAAEILWILKNKVDESGLKDLIAVKKVFGGTLDF